MGAIVLIYSKFTFYDEGYWPLILNFYFLNVPFQLSFFVYMLYLWVPFKFIVIGQRGCCALFFGCVICQATHWVSLICKSLLYLLVFCKFCLIQKANIWSLGCKGMYNYFLPLTTMPKENSRKMIRSLGKEFILNNPWIPSTCYGFLFDVSWRHLRYLVSENLIAFVHSGLLSSEWRIVLLLTCNVLAVA